MFQPKKTMRIALGLLLAASFAIQPPAGHLFAAETDAPASEMSGAGRSTADSAAFSADMQQALASAERLLYDQKPFSDWAALGFMQNGSALPAGYREELADELLNNRGRYDKVTDLTSSIIGYGAAGGDFNHIAGLDLSPVLLNHPGMEAEGVNGLASALIAANNARSNTIGPTEWYPDKMVYRILDLQLDDGSFPLTAASEGSVEATAMALSVLVPSPDYGPIEDALRWLGTQQAEDGGFAGGTTAAAALVIIALAAQHMDAAEFSLPNGHDPLEFLLSRQLPEGGFSQSEEGGLDMAATVQAYLALTAYKLYADGHKELFKGWSRLSADHAVIEIEGPDGTIASGSGQGGDAISSAAAFLEKQGIDYELTADSAGQRFFSSIGGIGNGSRFGDKAGWRLAAKSNYGGWMFPENFPDGLRLYNGDRLLLYYGAADTAVVDQLVVEWTDRYGQSRSSGPIDGNTPFVLHVKKANRSMSYLPAPGVTVRIGGKTAVSDAKGKIKVAGLPPGVHGVTLAGYRKDAVPSIAKSILPLHVSAPELDSFEDEAQVPEWARGDIVFALSEGFMMGISAQENILAPKQPLTRAEFTVMLLRLLNETEFPASGIVYPDVPTDKWYSEEIARAYGLGITDRMSGRFEPDRAITREEAAIMTAHAGRLATYGSEERMKLADIAGLPGASRKAVQAVFEHGIMTGSEGKFSPKQALVREQAAAILARLHFFLYAYTS